MTPPQRPKDIKRRTHESLTSVEDRRRAVSAHTPRPNRSAACFLAGQQRRHGGRSR